MQSCRLRCDQISSLARMRRNVLIRSCTTHHAYFFVNCVLIILMPSIYRAQRRLRELAQAAHFLKGSSSNIGVLSIRLTCEEIQHAAEANVSFVEEQNRQAAHLNELLIKCDFN